MNCISEDARLNQQALHTEASMSPLKRDAAKGREAEETLKLSADTTASVTDIASNAQNPEATSNEDDCEQPVHSSMVNMEVEDRYGSDPHQGVGCTITHHRTKDIGSASTIRMHGMTKPAGENGAAQGYDLETVEDEKMGAVNPVSGNASAESGGGL
jgi:hypothetical protein